MIAGWMGIKRSYAFLCIAAWASVVSLFWFNDEYGLQMIVMGTIAGVFVTAFFGWLPKYLSELFPTRIRATGQGFCYNGGRIVAGVGVLGTGFVTSLFGSYKWGVLFTASIYLTGLIVILFAPSTSSNHDDE
jgi:MFS family permease